VPFVVGCLLSTFFCVAAATKMFPLIDGDGTAYFPAAVEWSLNRPFTNPVWLPPLNDSIDGPGGRRYIYHGFLNQLVVGDLGRTLGGGPRGAVYGAYVVHWLVAIIGALAILSWSSLRGRAQAALAVIAPLSMLALSVAWHGRVEPFALLIVAGACLALRSIRGPGADAVAAFAAVLLVFTSPVCGALATCLTVAWIFRSEPAGGSRWRHVASATLGGGLALSVALWMYPYAIGDWVGGVIRHGRLNLGLPGGSGFFSTWLTRTELPLLLITIGILAVAAVSSTIAFIRSLEPAVRWYSALALVAFSVVLIRVAFVKTEASYNAVVWVPLMASVAFHVHRSDLAAWSLIGALALPVVGLSRSSVLVARQFTEDAVGFGDVQRRIRELAPFGCSVTSGLWLAVDHLEQVNIGQGRSNGARFLIQQETNTGRSSPLPIDGYRLVDNHFRPGWTLFGLPISRTAAGWEYAVYERQALVQSDASSARP